MLCSVQFSVTSCLVMCRLCCDLSEKPGFALTLSMPALKFTLLTPAENIGAHNCLCCGALGEGTVSWSFTKPGWGGRGGQRG